jgi:hypothetical protein
MLVNNVRCQIILQTTVAMSAAEKARNDSVRTLPRAPRLKLSDMAEASSGASSPKFPTLSRDVHWSARLTDGLPG